MEKGREGGGSVNSLSPSLTHLPLLPPFFFSLTVATTAATAIAVAAAAASPAAAVRGTRRSPPTPAVGRSSGLLRPSSNHRSQAPPLVSLLLYFGHVTFICGRAGVCALGAVVAKHLGDERLLDYYLSSFKKIKISEKVPNELLYGRAGYLWACSFINKHIGMGAISSIHTSAIAKEIFTEGKKLSNKSSCPLMYEWHGKMYWGAAHGLAGIMHVLMDTELKPEEQELVKGTLRYLIQHRFPGGNYPSSEGSEADRLVHWCHGAPGVSLTLTKAAQVFGEEEFLRAAADAAEVVWNRGLLKRVGICHGVSGNAYTFLSLYRVTGKVEYLYRAKAFACFLMDKAEQLIADGQMHGGDHPYSLFEGQGGMAYLLLDMVKPLESGFPAYEL